MEYFETHAHYDDEKFNEDREDIIKKIKEAGVTRCVNIGCNIETSEASIKLAEKYDFIYATCGVHPSEIADSENKIDEQVKILENMISESRKIIAIGEIGLDYHWNSENKKLQKYAFIKQIELANALNLPISIHTRDAIDDTIGIIKNESELKNGGILHCCPFNKELVKHGLEKGLYIAFGGTCTFKNSKNAKEIVQMVPFDKILIETDSPYLAPEPVRESRNDSSNLKYIVNKIAEVKECTPEKIAKITYENAIKVFKCL